MQCCRILHSSFLPSSDRWSWKSLGDSCKCILQQALAGFLPKPWTIQLKLKNAILGLLTFTETSQKLGDKNQDFKASFLRMSSKTKLYQKRTDSRTACWNFNFEASKLYALVLTRSSSQHLCTSMVESKVTSRCHLWMLNGSTKHLKPTNLDRHMNLIQKPSNLSQQLFWDLYYRAFTFNCRSLVDNHYSILPKGISSCRL